jgi:hypothetical protein
MADVDLNPHEGARREFMDVIEVTTEHGLFGKIVRDDNGVVLVNPPDLRRSSHVIRSTSWPRAGPTGTSQRD